MRPALRLAAILTFAFLALNSVVWGQSSTTSLRGAVMDGSGATIAKAKVTLSNPERSLERTVSTSSDGGYEFPPADSRGIPADGRDGRVQKDTSRTYIQLLVSSPATVNVTLEVGAVSGNHRSDGRGRSGESPARRLAGHCVQTPAQVKELPLEGRSVPRTAESASRGLPTPEIALTSIGTSIHEAAR